MRINIIFDFETVSIELITIFIKKIEKYDIKKIEIKKGDNLLKVNPITNKKYKNEKSIKTNNLSSAIKEIKLLSKITEFSAYFYSKNNLIQIHSNYGFIIISEEEIDYIEMLEFAKFNNLLSILIYNTSDKLLQSMDLHIGEMRGFNYVNFYPGYKLFLNKNLFPDVNSFINIFPPKVFNDNLIELTFSNSLNDITIEKKVSGLFSKFIKDKYIYASKYSDQIQFINYIIENNVKEFNNLKFEKNGFMKYKDIFKNGNLISYYYLDEYGNSVIQKHSSYVYKIFYNGRSTQETELLPYLPDNYS